MFVAKNEEMVPVAKTRALYAPRHPFSEWVTCDNEIAQRQPFSEWVTCGNEIARNHPKHEFWT
jgi:hypothetical protein